MAEISAAQVMNLRRKTDLPMMDCKKALEETGGNEAAAIELLQKKARGKLETKADRETAEGVIGVWLSENRKSAGMVELRCETAQVAKTEVFIDLARTIARVVAGGSDARPAPDALLAEKTHHGKTVRDEIGDAFGKVGENMKITACRRLNGEFLAEYVHHDGKTGVVVAFNAMPEPDTVGRDLCQHIAAMKPLAVTRESLPADQMNKIRELARQEALDQGKPAQIVDKIADGKVNAWAAEKALLEQEHVKVPKTKVSDVLKQAGVTQVTDMSLMVLGMTF